MSRRRNPVVREAPKPRVQIGIEDMVLLRDITDKGIMENLKTRLQAENIYTYIGHVLVACNPYKWLKIYEESVMKSYIMQSRIDMAPHVFATAEAAYRSMITEEDNQCIIISGESGAGKTEASKQIQSYIAKVSGGTEGVDRIKKVFLESNPVLEAFGNAKTLRNNNSSRFGKYFILNFNHFGCPLGGVISNYLLEKSRIVRPGKMERNFHIFYQLINSQHIDKFGLNGGVDGFNYLAVSECSTVDGMNDQEEFEITLAAMKNVGMNKSQIQAILTLLAAILHLGNLKFKSKQIDGTEGCELLPNCRLSLDKISELIRIDKDLILQAITTRELQTMAPGGKIDTYMVPQNPIQANARRDAISKSLYERMFDMIVKRINVALHPDAPDSQSNMLSIGVLDIYGFEIFDNNSFEQLCINYVNEKLQQIFIDLTLKAEQEEYEREGIQWTPIPFFNNRIVCELLDGAKPSGIFRILDDTCKTMHGTKDALDIDKKFIENCAQVHSRHAHFSQNTRAFTVKHYAGDVSYVAGKFGESNRDALNKDLVCVLKTSKDKLVQHLYPEEIDMNDKRAPPTAGFKIRNQCNDLVSALMQCSPHYVRCVKSNEQKRPLHIDENRVKHQVKYLGLAENIKVRRAGFAYRADFHRFLERFAVLSRKTYPDWTGSDKDGCKQIVSAILSKSTRLNAQSGLDTSIQASEMQLGNRKIFIRKPETYFEIERMREYRMGDFVVCIQRAFRRYIGRKEFVVLQTGMAELYAREKKFRRRDSIYRPFLGDYLDYCGKNQAELLRDAIFRIIDYYNPEENIVFADSTCSQLMNTLSPPVNMQSATETTHWSLIRRIVVLTDKALYLLSYSKDCHYNVRDSKTNEIIKALPIVLLERRVSLKSSEGIQSAHLSKLADNCIVFKIQANTPIPDAEAVAKKKWEENNAVTHCPVTNTPFSMFQRRHHCRVSGKIYHDTACNFRQPLPDDGLHEVQRIGDPHIGLESMQQLEDIVLVCDKKSELLSLVLAQWKKNNNRGGEMPINFGNTVTLQAGLYPKLARLPAQEITFREGYTVIPPVPSAPANRGKNNKRGKHVPYAETHGLQIEHSAGKLTIYSEAGLPHDVVEERNKRAQARRKKAEKRRKRMERERAQRAELKAQEREADRQRLLAEKKARKQAERAALAAEEEAKNAALSNKTSRFGGRKFGTSNSPPPGDDDTVTSRNPEAIGSPRSQRLVGGIRVASGAGNELAAAMAKRRARAEQ